MKIYNYISDNMVFQQDNKIIISGCNYTGNITATLVNTHKMTVDEPIKIECYDDEFKIIFDSKKGSFDSHTLTIKDEKNEVIINNIYIGDLILTAGQSNMSYSLGCVLKCEKYKSLISNLNIYCLNLLEADITEEGYVNRPSVPQKDICSKFKWEKVDENNIYSISALSVMLAVKLAGKVNYPIGFIATAMGGVSVDSYISYDECNNSPSVLKFLKDTDKLIPSLDKYNTYKFANYTQTGGIYNEKIYPLRYFSFKFVLWYQGENSCFNYESGKYYIDALNLLIASYRRLFDNNLPFIITGITDNYYPYGDKCGYLYISEALTKVCGDNIYYVPAYDLVDKWLKKSDKDIYYHPIHPINKEPIANRYYKIVYDNLYLNKIFYYPYVKKVKCENNKIILTIDLCGKGFKQNSQYFGFTIASEDGIYYSAKAISIDSKTIELSSLLVNNPCYYTYGLHSYSYLDNCKTKEGYPLIQSRSKFEDYKDSSYLLDHVVMSCDFIDLVENNFGYEVGGGFKTPLFETGDIFKSKVKISKDKVNKTEGDSSLLVKAKTTKDSYYYFSVKVNCGLSAIINRFKDFKYLNLDIKGDSDIEFHGIVFRKSSGIYKFSLINENGIIQFVKIDNEFKTYSVSISEYFDGSEFGYKVKDELDNLYSFELYFRSYGDCILNIDNIRVSNALSNIKMVEKEEVLDTSIVVPSLSK